MHKLAIEKEKIYMKEPLSKIEMTGATFLPGISHHLILDIGTSQTIPRKKNNFYENALSISQVYIKMNYFA